MIKDIVFYLEVLDAFAFLVNCDWLGYACTLACIVILVIRSINNIKVDDVTCEYVMAD